MAGELEKVREKLETIVPAAWELDKDRSLRKALEGVFGKDAKAKYEDCMSDTTVSMKECLKAAAATLGLDEKMETAWDKAPKELLNKLNEIRKSWTPAERKAIKTVARGMDLPKLYRQCAEGEYDDVASALGLDVTPTHFKGCAAAVAEAKDLRGAYETLWGTTA
jgi:hypothetical protein